MIEEKEEIWRDVPGYESLYQVSSIGRVKSMERKVKHMNGYRTVREKILKPGKDRYGYLFVHFSKEGIKKTMLVHRLVCESFLNNPNNLPEVNHRNEIKTDNRLENLEYCDRRYNVNYGTGNELRSKKLKGVYNTKLSKKVLCVESGIVYQSSREVERKLGFNQASVQRCCVGKQKSSYGLHFEYV